MNPSEEVINSYLIWQLCKQKGIQEMIIQGHPEKELREVIEKVREEYRSKNYSRSEKVEILWELDDNPEHRAEIFEDCSWSKETVKVEDLGTTLPHAMGLPPEVISGSIPDVIEFARSANPEEYRSVKYIEALKDVHEILDEFAPWVIHPGQVIRKRERMDREHGEKNWEIDSTWGAINDGNHRTIARIMANDLKKIKCYVGRPETLQ